MARPIIVADAGHFKGCANGGVLGYKEDEFALYSARAMKEYLESRYDVEVFITRDEKTNPSLGQRSQMALDKGAIGFVSWHSNATGVTTEAGKAVRGPQVYYHLNAVKGKELAEKTLEAILKATGYTPTKWTKVLSDGTLYANGFGVFRPCATKIPSILIEALYHSNVEDEKLLMDKAFRDKVVMAVSETFAEFFKLNKLVKAETPKEEPVKGEPIKAGGQKGEPIVPKVEENKDLQEIKALLKDIDAKYGKIVTLLEKK